MTKKKDKTMKGIMDTTKFTIGVGVANAASAPLIQKAPSGMQKPLGSAMGMLGAVPMIKASKTALDALSDWEDIDL